MARPICIALAQVAGRPATDVEGFAEHAKTVMHGFPATELLVYPELHLAAGGVGASDEASVRDSAEPIDDGPRHRRLAQVAADLGIWLCPGSVREIDRDGHIYNTTVVYSPEGRLVASYRKIFPWRPVEQSRPGSGFVVFDIPERGRIGLSICYDAWFPESARHLAWMGAELILNVVQTATVDREIEVVITRANAAVNQVYIAGVNASSPSGLGHSLLVGPEGNILSELPGATPGVLTAVVDLEAVSNARRFGSFAISRPWSQMLATDDPIPLPLYGGSLTAERWMQIHSRRP